MEGGRRKEAVMGLISDSVSRCRTNSPRGKLRVTVWDPPLRVMPPRAGPTVCTGPLQPAMKEGCSQGVEGVSPSQPAPRVGWATSEENQRKPLGGEVSGEEPGLHLN